MTQTLFLPSLHQWTRQKQVDGRCSALVPAVWWSLWKLLSNHVCEHVWSLPHLEAVRVWGPGGNEQPEVEAGDPGGPSCRSRPGPKMHSQCLAPLLPADPRPPKGRLSSESCLAGRAPKRAWHSPCTTCSARPPPALIPAVWPQGAELLGGGPALGQARPSLLLQQSPGDALGRQRRGRTRISLHISLPASPRASPPCQGLRRPTSPWQRFPPPELGSLGLSSWQSLVRKPACLSSSQWCCSAVPMATALGVLPLPGNCPEPVPALCSPCWKGTGRESSEGRAGDAAGGCLGCAAGPALCLSSWALRVDRPEARPGLQQSPTRGLGGRPAKAGARPGLLLGLAQWCLVPTGPALLPGLPETSLQSQRLPANPMAAPPRCPPGLRPCQAPLPLQLPLPTVAPFHSKRSPPPSFQNTAANRRPLIFLSPRPPHPGPGTRALHSRPALPSKAGPHLPCAPGGGLAYEGRARKLEVELGAEGPADRAGGKGQKQGRRQRAEPGYLVPAAQPGPPGAGTAARTQAGQARGAAGGVGACP